ncbi:MAG: branched-chain amino acid ABC transporter permease [Desulfitobacteriaceae bacterium]
MNFDSYVQLLLGGITQGSIYALIAIGFVTTYNVTGVINFAQGEYAMVSALTMISLTGAGVSFWLALIVSVLISIVISALLERFCVNPARRAGSDLTLIMITLGADIVIRGIGLLVWGSNPQALPPFTAGGPLNLLGVAVQLQSLWIFGVSMALVVVIYIFFNRSLLGKALRACMMDKVAARLMGIRPIRMSMLAFTLSAAMTGLAGITMAPATLAIYDMGLMLGIKGFVAAVIGGLTSPMAAIAGGFLLGIIESLGAGLLPSGYKEAVAFGVLLIVLFVRPNGLLGVISSKRV